MMSWDLKKIGMLLVIGFFVTVFAGNFLIPTKVFIATTSPDKFPYQISNLDSFSVTSLPGDHVVACYIRGNNLYYKESTTRGFTWNEEIQLPINSMYFNSSGNLTVRAIENSNGYELIIAWDSLTELGNNASRKAYYAVIGLTGYNLIKGVTNCSEDNETIVEYNPSITGDDENGYCMAWVTNSSGNATIAYRLGTSFNNFGSTHVITNESVRMDHPSLVTCSDSRFKIIYFQENNSVHEILYRDIMASGSLGQVSKVVDNTADALTFDSVDSSVSSTGFLVISYLKENGTGDFSFIHQHQLDSAPGVEKIEELPDASEHVELQHVIFSNDQVLTVWLEETGGTYDIYYTIIDFDMDNKNSIYHSMLLSYIFFACGLFNFFVYLNIRKQRLEEEKGEPMNNIMATILFWILGVLFILPFSGFQGETLGQSYADGFVIPPPINLGAIIVIGFSFLFYLISTPLIDKYWKREIRKTETRPVILEEVKPFSLKQELVRKIPHMVCAILVPCFHPWGSNAMKFTAIQKYDEYNYINEGAIIFDYALRLGNVELGSYAFKLVITAGLIFLWLLDLHVLLAPKKEFFAKSALKHMLRKKEKNSMADFVVMLVSIEMMIILLTFNPEYKLQGHYAAFAIIMSVSIADTMAVFVGKTLGKHHFSPRAKKTWEGAIGGFLTSFGLSMLFSDWYFALIVGGVYLLVDLITPKIPISDNILIPLLSAIALLPFLPSIEPVTLLFI
ncbi:MAG: phosphatidate cytidylyltransferase [Candidatus Hodarchaeota archaeon]